MVEFRFDNYNKIITGKAPDTDFSVQQIYDACREYEQQPWMVSYPRIVSAGGKEDLGSGVKVGVTVTLIDWKFKFEARGTPTVCTVSGGNLVRYNTSTSQYEFPLEYSTNVMGFIARASSATLQELEAIQFSSFQGGIWVDVVNGQSGTDFPIGTREFPVDNFTDASTIGVGRGFNTFYIIGDGTCSGHNLDGKIIVGENPILTTITLSGGCSTEGTEFRNCTITGTFDGEVEIRDAVIDTVSGFKGTAYNCSLTGNITLGGTSSDLANFLDCYLGTAYISLVEFDMNGDGPHLGMRGYSGGLKVKNKTGTSKVAIDFQSGRIEITNTVTAGTFFLRGVGEITSNQGTGITINDDSLINTIVLAAQEGNVSYEFVKATVDNETRNVQVGVVDRMIIKVKADDQADWSSPISTKTLYYWYEAKGAVNPERVGESD